MRTNGKWIAIIGLCVVGLGCDEPKDDRDEAELAELEAEEEAESEEEESPDLAGQDCEGRGGVNACGLPALDRVVVEERAPDGALVKRWELRTPERGLSVVELR